jgi:hypothetical protein
MCGMYPVLPVGEGNESSIFPIWDRIIIEAGASLEISLSVPIIELSKEGKDRVRKNK